MSLSWERLPSTLDPLRYSYVSQTSAFRQDGRKVISPAGRTSLTCPVCTSPDGYRACKVAADASHAPTLSGPCFRVARGLSHQTLLRVQSTQSFEGVASSGSAPLRKPMHTSPSNLVEEKEKRRVKQRPSSQSIFIEGSGPPPPIDQGHSHPQDSRQGGPPAPRLTTIPTACA